MNWEKINMWVRLTSGLIENLTLIFFFLALWQQLVIYITLQTGEINFGLRCMSATLTLFLLYLMVPIINRRPFALRMMDFYRENLKRE